MSITLDMECLRTLIAIADTGTRARAAESIGRTPAAVSLQIGRLEERLGVSLFRPDGRRRVLTEDGERLLGYARRLLSLNDEAVAALAPEALSGPVRFGTTQDFADTLLPGILGDFARAHPAVRLKVRVESSAALRDAVATGALHLALAVTEPGSAGAREISRLPMVWLGREGTVPDSAAPLPLVLFEPPCPFRRAALEALDRTGRPWRIAYTSPSLSGLRAAVEAGLGVTVRTALLGEGTGLSVLSGLPRLPEATYALYSSSASSPALDRLRSALETALP